VRTEAIERDLIEAREEAIKSGKINPAEESVAVIHMHFYPLDATGHLMSPQFQQSVGHTVDGLIFQPCDEVGSLHCSSST